MSKIVIDNNEIEYEIKKSNKAKRLRVAVYCDTNVVITVPSDFSDNNIERLLKDKASWILDKINLFKKSETKIHLGGNEQEYIENKDKAYSFVLKKVNKICKKYGFTYNKINIKNQKTKWGSCSKKKNLNFNYKIIFLPEKTAEYIIVHELCHLKIFNHSQKFWNLVDSIMPGYKIYKITK